jgi:hypothetical protein
MASSARMILTDMAPDLSRSHHCDERFLSSCRTYALHCKTDVTRVTKKRAKVGP